MTPEPVDIDRRRGFPGFFFQEWDKGIKIREVESYLRDVVKGISADRLAFVVVASTEAKLAHFGRTVPREEVAKRLRAIADDITHATPPSTHCPHCGSKLP